jgi:hypothetical protein
VTTTPNLGTLTPNRNLVGHEKGGMDEDEGEENFVWRGVV